ncbi:hypothetical protein [Shewanella carassii]|uniref:Uncharacterized protein n=1 Tax=Shewanella carassii TaxID=1987584 RepID=A0ABQ1T9A0_9GAMM|nr:hypothetical protein [Shewanella carassii]GGE87184.1 hypothetical protein GCM10011520_29580 [Shewanella carassii]
MPSYANAAEQSVAINYIHEEGQAKGSKLAYKLYPDTLKPISEDLELPLEASINFWKYGENNQHDVNHLLAISPILRDPLTRGQWLDFYLEAVSANRQSPSPTCIIPMQASANPP